MIVLVNREQHESSGLSLIYLFGTGLIGRSILNELMRCNRYEIYQRPFTWSDKTRQQADMTGLQHWSSELIRNSIVRKLSILWCAGSCGFSSTCDELQCELANFDKVLQFTVHLRQQYGAATISFHLMSSAGGLFEGQTLIDENSVPTPLRPYGELKLEQERRVLLLAPAIIPLIYRPSSVYGYTGQGIRKGLIPTLIDNGMIGRVTQIYGEMNTLRNYILVDDIGRFVAERVKEEDVAVHQEIYTLAWQRACSIFEIKTLTESLLGRHLYLTYRTDNNLAPNTYHPSILPAHWRPVDIQTGMRRVYHRALWHKKGQHLNRRLRCFEA